MSTTCAHPNVQTAVTTQRISDHVSVPRTLWVCQDCGNTWPANPRQLAAANDGLAEELTAAINAAGGEQPEPHELLLLAQGTRRALDLYDLALVDTAGTDIDMDSFKAGITFGMAGILQVLGDHGLIAQEGDGRG